MMTTKTTDWRVEHYPKGSVAYGPAEVWEVVDDQGFVVATCWGDTGKLRAEMIARMPDEERLREQLLEALEELLADYDTSPTRGVPKYQLVKQARAAIDAARAVD